jgi:hypothetical protein
MRFLTLTTLILLTTTGCLPVMVGGLIYDGTATMEAKSKFLQSFNETNFKREKEGLKPLDLCQEKRNFDPKWAKEDVRCNVMI